MSPLYGAACNWLEKAIRISGGEETAGKRTFTSSQLVASGVLSRKEGFDTAANTRPARTTRCELFSRGGRRRSRVTSCGRSTSRAERALRKSYCSALRLARDL